MHVCVPAQIWLKQDVNYDVLRSTRADEGAINCTYEEVERHKWQAFIKQYHCRPSASVTKHSRRHTARPRTRALSFRFSFVFISVLAVLGDCLLYLLVKTTVTQACLLFSWGKYCITRHLYWIRPTRENEFSRMTVWETRRSRPTFLTPCSSLPPRASICADKLRSAAANVPTGLIKCTDTTDAYLDTSCVVYSSEYTDIPVAFFTLYHGHWL